MEVFISIMSPVWSVYEPGESVGRENSQTLQCENDGEIHLCSVISFHWLPEAKAGKDVSLPKGTHESRVLQKGIHKKYAITW